MLASDPGSSHRNEYFAITGIVNSVGAAGIELASPDPESWRIVAKTRELAPTNSPGATVGDGSCGPEAVPAAPTNVAAGTDDAIFAAYKVAKAAGDVDRARALLALLSPTPAAAGPASVTPLALMRVKGRCP
jgi:hypothetical protein